MVNVSSKNRNLVYKKFALLCIELKYLYVAITRTKTRLIIFDENNKSRVPIQRIWENLEVVEVLTKLDIENQTNLTGVKAKVIEEGAFKCTLSSQDEWKL